MSLIAKCSRCGEEVSQEEVRSVEAFERAGNILCEACFEELSDEDFRASKQSTEHYWDSDD